MRTILIVSLAALGALAAAPSLAQKPDAYDPSDPREIYRDRGIALCVAEMNAVEGETPDDSEGLCGCAFERFMPRWPTGALPPPTDRLARAVMGSELLACAAGQDAELAATVGRHLARSSPAAPPVAAAPAPPALSGKPAGEPEASGFNLRAWLGGLSLPRWLAGSGLPRWAWLGLALLVIALLRALFRGRDRDDLMGPPPSMRPAARPAPRRPDFPPQR